MMRRATLVAAVLAALAALVVVGRWEERRAAARETTGMQGVLDAVGGKIADSTLSGYRFGPPDCLAYFDRRSRMLLALQLCFNQQGRLVEAVDRRPAQPRYYSLEYEPSLSTIRFPRSKIDRVLQFAATGR